jgi:RimJ/RimL family protein N-acetyltransferase
MTLWHVRATVDDRPGYLAVLAASLALRSVNILSVQVHAAELGAIDDFLVDAPNTLSEEDLLAAVVKGRGRDPWVRRADAHGLVDSSTQLLGLATRLVRDPDDLGAALVALLGDCAITWRPGYCQHWSGFSPMTLRLPDPSGGTLQVHRLAPPFTPAEYARAHAMVDLVGAISQQATTHWRVLLAGGAELTVRPARDEDVDAIVALHERCSPATRYRRYLCGTAGPSAARLLRMVRMDHGYTLVVEAEPALGGQPVLVAMANLLWEGSEAELGLLVADDWQRHGLGSALLHRLVRLAEAAGIEALHAHTHADNAAMIATMRRLGHPLRQEADGPILTLTADLRTDIRAGTDSPFPAQ